MSHLQPAGRSSAHEHRNSLKDPSQAIVPHSHLASRRVFILSFDGTGNKFSGGTSDSNILKIYRMLDRNDGAQFPYYQPGIGTYISSAALSNTSLPARLNSWYQKARDSAVGTSFDEHVMAAYKFLMRYYTPGDDIYFFGFSRGAYVARFLAEMLDYVGLLTAGNEELTRFAWKTFAQWQQRGDSNDEEKRKKKAMFEFMRAFRETFSRPVKRIRFLGLFDTVNSVPRFESAWMRRSKFPYTARSSAKVIRHAVSIDERRAKFRQDLISQEKTSRRHHGFPHHRPRPLASDEKLGRSEVPTTSLLPEADGFESTVFRHPSQAPPAIALTGASNRNLDEDLPTDQEEGDTSARSIYIAANQEIASMDTDRSQISLQLPEPQNDEETDSDGKVGQDIEEVWFPGCHADIGGGWSLENDEEHPLSHGPLVWMVREAQKAGLQFDQEKMMQLNCCEDYKHLHQGNDDLSTSQLTDKPGQPKTFPQILHSAAISGRMHDCLLFNNGVPRNSVLSWKIMEYLPFRRMDLQPDGSWKSIRWPLPKGEVRDIPDSAWIHNSALKRMEADENYRPGNLIVGGGGRGVRRAPKHLGIGEWVVLKEEGDVTGEVLVRKKAHSELAV